MRIRKFIGFFFLFMISKISFSEVKAETFNDSVLKITYHLTRQANPEFPKYEENEYLVVDGNKSYFYFYPGAVQKDGKEHTRPGIIKDRDSNKIYFLGPMVPEYPIDSYWEDSLPPMHWQVYTEYATIQNTLCQKASTFFRGRAYTAYFALNIPVQDGPWKFSGLPGLIMKIGDSKGIYNFEVTKIEKLPDNYSFSFGKVNGDYDQYKSLYKKWYSRMLEKRKARQAADPNCLDCGDGAKITYSFYENILE